MVAGYTISSIVRPLVALAASPLHVLAVRVTDRVGKGLRSSPRDALLAASLDPNHASLVYSFHRAMDHFGAAIGPLLALAVLAVVGDDLRLLFLCSAIPGVLAVATATFFVREQRTRRSNPSPSHSFWGGPATLRVGYAMRRLLLPIALFTLANASEAFLLLRASEVTVGSLTTLPLLWVALHLVKTVASPVMGAIADRRGATQSVAVGFALFVAIYAALALVESRAAVFSLFLLYGIHVALVEGPQKAIVSQLAHAGERATAFGWYHMTVGLLTLPGALLFGWLWDTRGHATAFATGAVLGAFALIIWLVAPPMPPAPPVSRPHQPA